VCFFLWLEPRGLFLLGVEGSGLCAGWPYFSKTYASAQRFLRYSHESAYVLAKGRPELPANPISDVLPWHYTGNFNHPTEKAVDTLKPIIEAFSKAGDVVLDPFSGSGSSLVAAALLGRQYIGIELEQEYCDHARRRLAGVMRHLAIQRREPQRERGSEDRAFQGRSHELRRDPA
jgi:DNA methylase